jgi:transposase
MESTGIYWVPIYSALEDAGFQIVLANPRQVKAVPGRKTDQSDSEWLAYLLRAELVKPSYIPERKLRLLRSLTRLRTQLTQNQSDYKNRVHKILQLCNIRLASTLTDIFGKSGRIILDALMTGRSLDEALTQCPKRIQARSEEVKATILGTLNQTDLLQLKICLEMIDTIQEKIHKLDGEIAKHVDAEAVRRVSTVPGVKETSAASIIAEIGDPARFPGEKQIGAYAGLVPSVRQSAKRRWYGGITKHGSRWLRRTLTQCALAAIKVRDSKLRMYYLNVKSRRGHNIAITALARKLLVIIHHLLLTGEEYVEKAVKRKRLRIIKPSDLKVSLEDAVALLSKAGFTVADYG